MSDLIVPRVFRRDTEALCNSDDVRKHFGKRHDNVLRDIRDIMAKMSSNHRDMSWFRESAMLDNYGREQPTYDMTKDGFAVLVMGWTGEKAMAFKIAYIAEFNRMEQGAHHLLGDPAEPDASKLAKVREARQVFGLRAAAALWLKLGLDTVPEMFESSGQRRFDFGPPLDESIATDPNDVN